MREKGVRDRVLLTWLPPISFTVVNWVIPWIMCQLTDYEGWDFAEETLRSNLVKTYYSGVMNVLIFIFLSWYNILIVSDHAVDVLHECKEDVFADTVMRIILVELATRIFWYILSNVYNYIRSKAENSYSFRQEFDLNDEFTFIVFLRCWFWLAITFYPAIVYVDIILMFLHLYYTIWRLKNERKQPIAASNDMALGNSMLKYLTLTFMLVALFFGFILY